MCRPFFLLLLLGCCLSLTPTLAYAGVPDADMQLLKERFLTSLYAPSPTLTRTVAEAQHFANGQQPEGTWADIDYLDRTRGPWKPNDHLKRLKPMAQALKSPFSPLFGDAALQAKTLWGLRVWLEKDLTSLNWWHNQIGAPRQVGEIALLMEGDLTAADKARVVRVLKRSLLSDAVPGIKTGANLVWLARNQMASGLLQGDTALVEAALGAIWDEVKISGPREGQISEGVQADWSFHQHGAVLYSGGYGSVFTREEAEAAFLARGTRFGLAPEKQRILEALVLDGQGWMTRGGRWDPGVKGREIVRDENLNAQTIADAAAKLAQLPGARRAELLALVERFRGVGRGVELEGNRHFYASDFMVHHRAAFYASVRMFSTRIDNTDSLTNDENKKSHHIADGASLLLRRGDEYERIFPVWDWQKIPGTTTQQNPEPLDPKTVRRTGRTSFVGGVSDGKYGVCAMALERDGLSARKAWFFFDDAYVCLGAGINDGAPHPIVTSVNQCLLRGEVLTPRGPISGAADLSGLPWVRHDGVTYLFPSATPIRATIGAQTGSWSAIGNGPTQPVTTQVFNLWIEHGAQPSGATYAYIVRPADSGPPAPNAGSQLEIVSNTPELQAVRHRALKTLGVVFARAGQIDFEGATLRVDQPCLLLCRQTPAGFAVSASNPENKPLQVRIDLKRGGKTSQTIFDLPGGAAAGSSVTHIIP